MILFTNLVLMYHVLCAGLHTRWRGWRTLVLQAGAPTCRWEHTSRNCSNQNCLGTWLTCVLSALWLLNLTPLLLVHGKPGICRMMCIQYMPHNSRMYHYICVYNYTWIIIFSTTVKLSHMVWLSTVVVRGTSDLQPDDNNRHIYIAP